MKDRIIEILKVTAGLCFIIGLITMYFLPKLGAIIHFASYLIGIAFFAFDYFASSTPKELRSLIFKSILIVFVLVVFFLSKIVLLDPFANENTYAISFLLFLGYYAVRCLVHLVNGFILAYILADKMEFSILETGHGWAKVGRLQGVDIFSGFKSRKLGLLWLCAVVAVLTPSYFLLLKILSAEIKLQIQYGFAVYLICIASLVYTFFFRGYLKYFNFYNDVK